MLSSLQKKLVKAARCELADRLLDSVDFPEELRPEVERILKDDKPETAIYRLFNLVVPTFMLPSQLQVDSLSLSFMNQLYSSLDVSDMVGKVNASALAELSTNQVMIRRLKLRLLPLLPQNRNMPCSFLRMINF